MNGPDMPDVSVVIPARNAEGVIGDQLEALTRQADAAPFEVIVVVNGCSDATEAEALSFKDRLDLNVIHSEPGYSSARNAGVLAARSDVVLFCDADDAVRQGWLTALAEAVKQRGGIVGGFFGYTRFNSREVCRINGIDPEHPDGREAGLGSDEYNDRRSVSGGNFGVKRTDYIKAGGLDQSYRGGLEETDFCFRARSVGIPVTFCPDARVEVRLRKVGAAAFKQQRGYARNKVLFTVRADNEVRAGRSSLPYAFDLSFKWSVGQLVSTLTLLPAACVANGRRVEFMHRLGGHFGSIEGHLLYRVFHRIPSRQLMSKSMEREL